MEQNVALIIMFALMLGLLFGGSWIFVALGAAAAVALMLLGDVQKLTAAFVWEAANSWDLSTLPLFIFMGEIIVRSGLSTPLYDTVSLWLGRLPGGLLHTNVAASALFACVSGSTVATCATIGTVAIPAQRAQGYSEKLVLGSVAASGTLGILIPPSINMIIYASWVQVSLGKLFMGGFIPGIIVALMFMIYIGFTCWRHPMLAPVTTRQVSLWEKVKSLTGVLPVAVIFATIWGGIYTGWMTPTETAGVSCAAACLLAVTARRLSWEVLTKSLLGAVEITSMTMIILISAKLMATVAAYTNAPGLLVDLIKALNLGPYQTLFAIYLAFSIAACFISALPLMFLTLPFAIPLLNFYGFDLIWFGVILVVLIEIGALTPPYAVNLFVVSSIAKVDMGTAIAGIWPFIAILAAALLLFTIFPDIILFLPHTMM